MNMSQKKCIKSVLFWKVKEILCESKLQNWETFESAAVRNFNFRYLQLLWILLK